MPSHDPTELPSGKPCPSGFNWDGVRLVRNKRGPKRPPDTEEAALALPVMRGNIPEPHREKLFCLCWEQLGEVTDLQLALVARVVSQAKVEGTPAAKAAMDKEWQQLVDKSCWLEKKVHEFRDISADVKRPEKAQPSSP